MYFNGESFIVTVDKVDNVRNVNIWEILGYCGE